MYLRTDEHREHMHRLSESALPWSLACTAQLAKSALTLHAQISLVRVAQGLTRPKCLEHSICVLVILKESSHRSHAMFSTLLDPPFTAPSQSTSISSLLLFLSKWTPTATRCSAELLNNPLSQVKKPKAPVEGVATLLVLPSRMDSFFALSVVSLYSLD